MKRTPELDPDGCELVGPRWPEAHEDDPVAEALALARLGTFEWDLQSDIVTLDVRAREIWGFRLDEIVAAPAVFARIHPDDRPRVEAEVAEARQQVAQFDTEYRVRLPNGTVRWVASLNRMRPGPEGAAARATGVFQDVTAERSAVAALREGEARLAALVRASSEVLYSMSPDWAEMRALAGGGFLADTTTANPHWLEDYIHPDDHAAVRAAIDEAIRTKGVFHLEHRVRRADGTLGWTLSRAVPLLDAAGEITEWFGAASDMTERRRAELALRASAERQAFRLALEERLRDLADPLEVIAVASEALGRHLGVNQVIYAEAEPGDAFVTIAREWNDGSMSSNAGRHRLDDFGPAFVAELRRGKTTAISDVRLDPRTFAPEALAAFSQAGIRALLNVPLIKAGRMGLILGVHSASPQAWSAEEVALAREVAERTWAAVERARAEAALRQSEAELRELNATLEARVAERTAEREQLARIVDTTGTLIQALDADYRWIALNRATAEVLVQLYGRSSSLGESLLDYLGDRPEHLAEARAPWDQALRGETLSVVGDFGDPAFQRRSYELTYGPLYDAEGRVTGAFMTGLDVTERLRDQARLREAEEALRQSQKMEAMGQLTGGVAHDFNNLLTPIIGSLDRLVTRSVGNERERRLMAGALESAERAKTVVQRLLAFARRQPLQPVAVDVGALVGGMAGLISSTLGPTIEVRVEVAPDLPPAHADPNQLEMALLNLAVNARDAMPEGGRLIIAASRESLQSKHRSGLTPGPYVRLSVADTGMGMDKATLARAVEPFFSTKGIGRGTGLGLSMVHGLTAQLGGALTIESHPGQGTMVELWLPLSAALVGRRGAQPITSVVTDLRGRALLVDDEDLVRMSTADMLADLGFEVLEAGSAEEALRHLREGVAVDLLVTDHLMPGMSGATLACEARVLRPELPVLVVSGYAEVEGIAPDLPRLTKPFRVAELAQRVDALTRGFRAAS